MNQIKLGTGFVLAVALAMVAAGIPAPDDRTVLAQAPPACTVNTSEFGSGASAANTTVLILQSSVNNGCSSVEAQKAVALGFKVEIASSTQWGAKTNTQFATYRAIVLGDPSNAAGTNCSTNPAANIGAAEANRAVWAPAVKGNIAIIGTDPVSASALHTGDTHGAGAHLTENAIRYATAGTATGAYVALSCYYSSATPGTPVHVLDQFGTFTVVGTEHNDVTVNDQTHPLVTQPNALSAADLDNWGSSIHERFQTWPSNFSVVASHTASSLPYIVARGGSVGVEATYSTTDPSELFVRDPAHPDDVFARLTFEKVLTQFRIRFTFTNVSKHFESLRLDPAVFGPARCLSYDTDLDECVRHTVRLIDSAGNDIGVPLQDVHFDGKFRLEMGFHSDDVSGGNIGTPILAQAIKSDATQIESPIDLYDRDILTSFRFNSCNCVGSGETDGFSDFILGEAVIPAGQKATIQAPLPPIQADGSSVLKSGRGLPVKFTAADSSGVSITSGLVAVLEVWKIADTVSGSTEISTDAVGNATGTQFKYNPSTGQWELIADTKGWPGGDYVAVIRSVYSAASPSNYQFTPKKFNFSVKP